MTTYNPTSTHGVHGYNGGTVVKEHREAPYFVAESTLKNQKVLYIVHLELFGSGTARVQAVSACKKAWELWIFEFFDYRSTRNAGALKRVVLNGEIQKPSRMKEIKKASQKCGAFPSLDSLNFAIYFFTPNLQNMMYN